MKLIFLALCATLAVASKVNINTANKHQLDTLWKVGNAMARKIITYRNQNGPFATIDDLANVSGLTTNTVQEMLEKAAAGTHPAPEVVSCPMSCEMKVSEHVTHTTPVLHLTHNKDTTASAHGPHASAKHTKCGTSTTGVCASSQPIKHTCKKLTNSNTACACYCQICQDKNNEKPCDKINNVCGKDGTTGKQLVFNPSNKKCSNCGARNQRACAGNTCDAADANDNTQLLTYNNGNGKCSACGRNNQLACGGTTCDASLVVKGNGKCGSA